MSRPRRLARALALAAASVACSPIAENQTASAPSAPGAPAADMPAALQSIALPGGEGGIGFDDLRFSPRLGRLIVPGGRTGRLFLVDPASGAVQAIEGFSAKADYSGGHGDGTTSADEGEGVLFAIDRTSRALLVIDAQRLQVVAQAALGGGPDYVRFVAPTRELWVTEPDAETIEVFRVGKDPLAAPERVAAIAVPGGPESLVVDVPRGRAWSHLWDGATVAIDLSTRAVSGPFRNGCEGSRGIALDAARGLLFAGCAEGRATVLDAAHDARQLSGVETGAGVDIIDYDAQRAHLYVPGGKAGTLSILGAGEGGALALLGSVAIPKGCHCVATDGAGRVFVGDPAGGRLLVIRDSFAGTSH